MFSKVDLPHTINFRALCGESLVTLRSNFEPAKPAKSTVCQYQSIYVVLFIGYDCYKSVLGGLGERNLKTIQIVRKVLHGDKPF